MRNNLISTDWATTERETNFLMSAIVKNFNRALAQITGDRAVVVIVSPMTGNLNWVFLWNINEFIAKFAHVVPLVLVSKYKIEKFLRFVNRKLSELCKIMFTKKRSLSINKLLKYENFCLLLMKWNKLHHPLHHSKGLQFLHQIALKL